MVQSICRDFMGDIVADDEADNALWENNKPPQGNNILDNQLHSQNQ